MKIIAAVAGAVFGIAGASAAAQETVRWSDSCADIHASLVAAFDEVPGEMAVGNRTKIERLLRDARVAPDRALCMTKLERAHELLQMAYRDSGAELDVIARDE
jgi:hypothetical protein